MLTATESEKSLIHTKDSLQESELSEKSIMVDDYNQFKSEKIALLRELDYLSPLKRLASEIKHNGKPLTSYSRAKRTSYFKQLCSQQLAYARNAFIYDEVQKQNPRWALIIFLLGVRDYHMFYSLHKAHGTPHCLLLPMFSRIEFDSEFTVPEPLVKHTSGEFKGFRSRDLPTKERLKVLVPHYLIRLTNKYDILKKNKDISKDIKCPEEAISELYVDLEYDAFPFIVQAFFLVYAQYKTDRLSYIFERKKDPETTILSRIEERKAMPFLKPLEFLEYDTVISKIEKCADLLAYKRERRIEYIIEGIDKKDLRKKSAVRKFYKDDQFRLRLASLYDERRIRQRHLIMAKSKKERAAFFDQTRGLGPTELSVVIPPKNKTVFRRDWDQFRKASSSKDIDKKREEIGEWLPAVKYQRIFTNSKEKEDLRKASSDDTSTIAKSCTLENNTKDLEEFLSILDEKEYSQLLGNISDGTVETFPQIANSESQEVSDLGKIRVDSFEKSKESEASNKDDDFQLELFEKFKNQEISFEELINSLN